MVEVLNPPAFADIRIFTGEQRSGKSCSMIGFAIHDYIDHMNALVAPTGLHIKAQALTEADQDGLKKVGLATSKLEYCRIFSEDGKQSKLVKIPPDYCIESPVHIFANFHLYGIRFRFISIVDIIQYINTDLFNGGWILSDESVMNDPRNSMTEMGKLMATFGSTIGKRNARLCLATQLTEMMERRFRAFATTWITCAYDEDTRYIDLSIKKRGEDEFETSYYAPQYWRFFDTTELIKVPQDRINRAAQKYYKAEVGA